MPGLVTAAMAYVGLFIVGVGVVHLGDLANRYPDSAWPWVRLIVMVLLLGVCVVLVVRWQNGELE